MTEPEATVVIILSDLLHDTGPRTFYMNWNMTSKMTKKSDLDLITSYRQSPRSLGKFSSS